MQRVWFKSLKKKVIFGVCWEIFFVSFRLSEWAEPHGTGFHEVSAFLSWILFHFSTSFLSFIFLFPGPSLVLSVWAARGGQGAGIITSGSSLPAGTFLLTFSSFADYQKFQVVQAHTSLISLMHRSIPQFCHRHEESSLAETKLKCSRTFKTLTCIYVATIL